MRKEVRPPGRRRKLALVALAAAGATLALVLPGAASAGPLPGGNNLTVAIDGTGGGTVVQGAGPGNGSATAIDCQKQAGGASATGVCTELVPFTAPPEPWVGVVAQPAPGSVFAGWAITPGATPSVDCGTQLTCYVQVTSAVVTVTATFTALPGFPLTVARQGPAQAQGVVTSVPGGIACSQAVNDCSSSYAGGTSVILTASVTGSASFGGWGGACQAAGTTPTCTVAMTQAQAVTATFNAATVPLTVALSGAGQGTVTSSPAGISCQPTCAAQVVQGTQVTLTASPAAGSTFAGWSGACSGTGTCVVTPTQATSVGAEFGLATVQAEVVGVKTFRTPFRYTRVIVDAGQPVKVVCRLTRDGVTLATRTTLNVSGERTIRIPIRSSVAPGKAKLQVQFTNAAGTTKTVTKNVKLPAVS